MSLAPPETDVTLLFFLIVERIAAAEAHRHCCCPLRGGEPRRTKTGCRRFLRLPSPLLHVECSANIRSRHRWQLVLFRRWHPGPHFGTPRPPPRKLYDNSLHTKWNEIIKPPLYSLNFSLHASDFYLIFTGVFGCVFCLSLAPAVTTSSAKLLLRREDTVHSPQPPADDAPHVTTVTSQV